jgi:signal transduction histidine kinase
VASHTTSRDWLRYLIAVTAPTVAYATQLAVWPRIPPSPYLLFYPAGLAVAWWCGRGPAMVTIFVSCVGIAYRFLGPFDSFAVTSARDMLDLAIFAVVEGVMCTAAAGMRGALADARAARHATEQMAHAKDEILNIVSHDLRTPLSAIVLSAETVRRRSDDAAHSREEAVRIKRLAMAASGLVADIVDLGRAEAGLLELDLRAEPADKLVADAIETALPQAEARHLELKPVLVSGAPVLCDAHRVQQILGNLMANALKLVPQGGTIAVAARRNGVEMRFEVRDSGPGMTREAQARVFDRHYTGDRRGGLGLGLHIAKTLVEAHHGAIGVESEPGAGSTFWFTLPLAAATTTPSKAKVDFRPAMTKAQTPSS